MILALVGQKGGTGKSTLAISLAGELMARGGSVLLVDADTKNRTSLRAAAIAQEEGRAHPMTVGMDAEELCRVNGVPRLAKAYTHVVIDAPGRSGAELTAPLMVADLALFPSAPTTADAGVFEDMLELCAPIRRKNTGLRLAVVLTKLLSRTTLAQGKAAASVYAPTGLDVLRSRTFTRAAWQRCLDVGVGVGQHAPHSPAAGELRSILREVLTLHRRKTQ